MKAARLPERFNVFLRDHTGTTDVSRH